MSTFVPDKPISPGTIVLLDELVNKSAESLVGQSVRVLGRLVEFDGITSIAVIEHKHCRLRVSTILLEKFVFKLGSSFQFVGEIKLETDDDVEMKAAEQTNASVSVSVTESKSSKSTKDKERSQQCKGVHLQARVARNADELDPKLFEQALALRRKFEQQHALS